MTFTITGDDLITVAKYGGMFIAGIVTCIGLMLFAFRGIRIF
jgi:hypothetical protein